MAFLWIKFAASAVCLGIGLVFMALAVFGVNRFKRALNRMHAAAMGSIMKVLIYF